MIDARALCERPPTAREYAWSDADFRRYADCVGGAGIVPTFPTVVAWVAPPTFTELGVDPIHALHGAQRIEWMAPLKGPCRVRVESRIVGVRDKGAARGAVIHAEQRITDLGRETPLAVLTTTCFGRREGGCGDAGRDVPSIAAVPARTPDCVVAVATDAGLARRYSLTGDANPLHTDPAVAHAAGFDRPILHGLCGFGIVARVLGEAMPASGPRNLAMMAARFTAPVHPGDELAVDLWWDGDEAAFRLRVPHRDVAAIAAGRVRMGHAAPAGGLSSD